jgi:serine/threonine protein kinase
VTNADIENETRAIIELAAGHKNVVAVLEHGWLDGPFRCYYFDMDLCDCDLEKYIYGDRSGLIDDDWVCTGEWLVVPRDARVFMKIMNICAIMGCIAEGLNFIHSNKQVHRDLKPRNSNSHALRLLMG